MQYSTVDVVFLLLGCIDADEGFELSCGAVRFRRGHFDPFGAALVDTFNVEFLTAFLTK